MFRLALSALFGATCALAQKTDVYTLKEGDNPEDFIMRFTFSVVSFYNGSDEESAKIDSFMEGAQKYMTEQVESEAWTPRHVGWFRIDMEKTPDLAMEPTFTPDQMVMAQGLRRMVDWKDVRETAAESEQAFATVIKELTGDWVSEIACTDIQLPDRENYVQVIYFGAKQDLFVGNKASLLNRLSMFDKYSFDAGLRTGFHYVEDNECRKEFGFEVEKEYLTVYMGETVMPMIREVVDEKSLDLAEMSSMLVTETAMIHARWNKRSQSAIFDYSQNSLIYIYPEDVSPDDMVVDWRGELMQEITDDLREKKGYMPIISSFHPGHNPDMPNLADLVEANLEDLPNFFIINPVRSKVVTHPTALDYAKNFDKDLILLWAYHSLSLIELEGVQLDVMKFEVELESLDPEKDEERYVEVYTAKAMYEDAIVEMETELEAVFQQYKEYEFSLTGVDREKVIEPTESAEKKEGEPIFMADAIDEKATNFEL